MPVYASFSHKGSIKVAHKLINKRLYISRYTAIKIKDTSIFISEEIKRILLQKPHDSSLYKSLVIHRKMYIIIYLSDQWIKNVHRIDN